MYLLVSEDISKYQTVLKLEILKMRYANNMNFKVFIASVILSVVEINLK